jgi:hypothetical protein
MTRRAAITTAVNVNPGHDVGGAVSPEAKE